MLVLDNQILNGNNSKKIEIHYLTIKKINPKTIYLWLQCKKSQP